MKSDVIVMDEGVDDDTSNETTQFWKELGGRGEIAPSTTGGDDLEVENKLEKSYKLYRLGSDNPNELELLSHGGKLLMEMLDSGSCFVLDCDNEIYVWIGNVEIVME